MKKILTMHNKFLKANIASHFVESHQTNGFLDLGKNIYECRELFLEKLIQVKYDSCYFVEIRDIF